MEVQGSYVRVIFAATSKMAAQKEQDVHVVFEAYENPTVSTWARLPRLCRAPFKVQRGYSARYSVSSF